MPFKKLHTDIQAKLADLEIFAPTPIQSKSIPIIKSGANIFCIAPKTSGKTTTLILTTLQKLNFEAVGNTPRAIVLVEDKESVMKLYDEFHKFVRYTSLRVYASYDQLHIDIQKSEIFEGIDILITTPKSLRKLFLLNGVNTSQLMIFNIDDAEFLTKQTSYNSIMLITQSIIKCQYIMYSDKMYPVLKRFESYFMQHSKKVSITDSK